MKKPIPVTDHAVLRYLERVAGVDVEAIRNRIYDQIKDPLAAGASGVISNGIAYRFIGSKVTTIWIEQEHIRPLIWQKDGDA